MAHQARAASHTENAALLPKPATSGTQTNQAHPHGTKTNVSQHKYLQQGALALHSRPCSHVHSCCSPLPNPRSVSESTSPCHPSVLIKAILHPNKHWHAKRQAAYARPTRKDLRPEALPYRRLCCGGVFAEGHRHCAAKTLLLLLRAHLPPPCAKDTKKASTPARREHVFAAASHEPSHAIAHTEEWDAAKKDGAAGRRCLPFLGLNGPQTLGRPRGQLAGIACLCPAPPAGRIWSCPKWRSRRI